MVNVTAVRFALSSQETQSASIYATVSHAGAEQAQHFILARRISRNGSVLRASANYTNATLIPGIAYAFTSARTAAAQLIGKGIATPPSAV